MERDIKTQKQEARASLVTSYISYVKKYHEDPSPSAFKRYLVEMDSEITTWDSGSGVGKLFNALTDIREAAIKADDSLTEFVFTENELLARKDEIEEQIQEAIKTHHRFVISSVVAGKAADLEAYQIIKSYCAANDAVLLLIPTEDVKSGKRLFNWTFDPIFKNELFIFKDTQLSDKVLISSIKVTAKQFNPTASLEGIVGKEQKSIFVAATKNRLKSTPAFPGEIPHILATTAGALTKNDYDNDHFMSQRTSKIASYYHTLGARVIELDRETGNFYTRELVIKEGSLVDLGTEYRAGERPKKVDKAVKVLGDSHAGQQDMELCRAIFTCLDDIGVVNELVLHDLCNSASISHHTSDDVVKRLELIVNDDDVLVNEINQVVKYLNLVSGAPHINKVSVVPSNHDNHIYKWVKSGRAFSDKDFRNIPTYCKLVLAVHEGKVNNVLQFLVENVATEKLMFPEKIQWLAKDTHYKYCGIELSLHGDKGANGARGSLKTFQNAVSNAIVGHSHSMNILDDVYQVGTTSEMDLGYNEGLSTWTRTCCIGYNEGLSTWTRTCCIGYPNGAKQLITYIPDGRGGYRYHI